MQKNHIKKRDNYRKITFRDQQENIILNFNNASQVCSLHP